MRTKYTVDQAIEIAREFKKEPGKKYEWNEGLAEAANIMADRLTDAEHVMTAIDIAQAACARVEVLRASPAQTELSLAASAFMRAAQAYERSVSNANGEPRASDQGRST